MNRFVIELANIKILIHCRYDYTLKMCKKYISDSTLYDFAVKLDYDIFEQNKQLNIKESVFEFVEILKVISNNLARFNRLLIHAAAIDYKGKGFLFLAPSGTGKTTHIKLLTESFDGIRIINGDKPIIDSSGYIYGTPWCGKENLGDNIYSKLKAVVILKRSDTDYIKKSNFTDCFSDIVSEIYKETNIKDNLEILNSALTNVDVYLLYCTKNLSSAELSYKKILNKE